MLLHQKRKGQTAPSTKGVAGTSCEPDAASAARHGGSLSFLGLPLADALIQLLLALERRRRGSGRRMMVVLFSAAERRAKQQVTDPGLNEGEGGAVGVSGRHHHLWGQRDAHTHNTN